MVKKYLLDSNILIDFINKRKGIDQILEGLELWECEICSIVCAEFLIGAYLSTNFQEQYKWYKDLIKKGKMRVLSFEESDSKIYAKIQSNLIKKGLTRPSIDLQIAAICIENNLTLVTKNLKDFEMIEGLKVYKA
jgi:tRNA(fMet)-specific endonuclease VapC